MLVFASFGGEEEEEEEACLWGRASKLQRNAPSHTQAQKKTHTQRHTQTHIHTHTSAIAVSYCIFKYVHDCLILSVCVYVCLGRVGFFGIG